MTPPICWGSCLHNCCPQILSKPQLKFTDWIFLTEVWTAWESFHMLNTHGQVWKSRWGGTWLLVASRGVRTQWSVLALSRAGYCPCCESRNLGTAEPLVPCTGAQGRHHLAWAQQSDFRTGCQRAASFRLGDRVWCRAVTNRCNDSLGDCFSIFYVELHCSMFYSLSISWRPCLFIGYCAVTYLLLADD